MPIPFPHLLGLVASPGVDHSLIDALAGTDRNERMPEDVPAANFIPATASQSLIEMVRSLVNGQLMSKTFASWAGAGCTSMAGTRRA